MFSIWMSNGHCIARKKGVSQESETPMLPLSLLGALAPVGHVTIFHTPRALTSRSHRRVQSSLSTWDDVW